MCPFQLQITVAKDQSAVASGELSKQTWSPDGQQKTFFYAMRFPTSASHIALAVGALLQYLCERDGGWFTTRIVGREGGRDGGRGREEGRKRETKQAQRSRVRISRLQNCPVTALLQPVL